MTADEIFRTTRFDRANSELIAAAMQPPNAYLESMFWALVTVGLEADEIADGISNLRRFLK